MSTRAEQKEKRRQEILEAGLEVFIRKGYAATQVRDIAQQAGMSTGLLFHYFESKEKLYEALIELGLSGPRSVMEFDQSDPLGFFEAVVRSLFGYLRENPFVAKMFVLMNQAHISEATPSAAKEHLAKIDNYTSTIPLIIAGQQNGTIREGDPAALSLAYWTAIAGIAEAMAVMPDAPCPEGDWIVDILRRKPE